MIFYFPIEGKTLNNGLLEIKNVKKCDNIINASEYEAFRKYEGYISLDNIYIINNYHCNRRNWQSWVVWIKFMQHLKSQEVNLLHFCWPFKRQRRVLYFLRIPMVLTVHDPIPHSSLESSSEEKIRRRAFRHAQRYLLLSVVQESQFCERYNIPREKVYISKFGVFDWIDRVEIKEQNINGKYIFFWGQIQAHKGIDVLLKSMLKVHEIIPDIKLVIAGRGDFYFDIEPYKQLDYIEFRNYYLTIPEMLGLLKHCLFAVAPYLDATQSGVVQTAFSANIPIIVTNVGSMPLSVSNGETGLIVPPGDSDLLADAIVKLASNDSLRQKFKDNIKNIWLKDMSWEPIGEMYEKFYSSIHDKNC